MIVKKGIEQNMKRIMINAYTRLNLGDDLFIKVLCERYPMTDFILYAPKEYKNIFSNMQNLKVISNSNIFLKVLDYLFIKNRGYSFVKRKISKNCDATVYIGGSLFIQNNNWKRNLESLKSLKIEDQPFFLLGSNFGPFKDKQFYTAYKEVFKEFTDICFRENYSYNLFQDLGNVRKASDVIFQIQKKDYETNQKNYVVISVIKPSTRQHLRNCDEIYYNKIKDISTYFVDKGYEVTLMSFCEYEGDKEAVDTIYNLIPKEYKLKVNKYYYELNISEALNVLANSKAVIATRFHSMILGWVYSKPVFPIIYSNKMSNVMSDLEFNGSYCELKKIDSLKPKDVFDSISTCTNIIDISEQVNDAEKQFEKLDEYLLK